MLEQIVALGFDRDKLLEEDTEELVKVNVHAFIEAEEYIQTRLKSRMYWLRPDKVDRTICYYSNRVGRICEVF